MSIWLFLFLILVNIILLTLAWSFISLAPFVPTRKRDLERIFELADFKSGNVFYELGSGNGRVILAAARKFNIKAVGFEIAWPLWLICKFKKIFFKDKNVNFKLQNLFKVNLSSADVVYFFGMPHSVKSKLQNKLKNELKPGAKVISYSFALPGWQAEKISKPYKKDAPIYLYVISKDQNFNV